MTRMQAAESRAYREFLCLTVEQMAERIGMTPANLARYEERGESISQDASDKIMKMVDETDAAIDVLAATLDRKHPNGRTTVVYRTDSEYRSAFPESTWTAAWHRAVTARAAMMARGPNRNRATQIVYSD